MISAAKRGELFGAMSEAGWDFAVLIDREGARNENLAYLTGHPTDAAVLIAARGEIILFPRDMKLAALRARNVQVVDASSAIGGIRGAVREAIARMGGGKAPAIAFPSSTPYFTVKSFEEEIAGARIVANPGALDRVLEGLRATKSPDEIRTLDRAFAVADEVVALLPAWLESNRKRGPRELDLGLYLQRQMLDRGTDGAREAMIVANADRSAQIHPEPQAGTGPFFKPGLALIDFWMVLEGYYTDLTIPFVIEPVSDDQLAMVETVLGIYKDTMRSLVTGASIADIADAAMAAIKAKGLRPVGGLGHGLGLSGHDAPHLSGRPVDEAARRYWQDRKLEQGMVLAVEPGVIHDVHGGFRLENDVVMGPERADVRTHAVPLRVKTNGKVEPIAV